MEGVVKRGYLSMLLRGIDGRAWQERWFVIRKDSPPTLDIYLDNRELSDGRKLLYLHNDNILQQDIGIENREYIIRLIQGTTEHIFSAETERENFDWWYQMKSVVDSSEEVYMNVTESAMATVGGLESTQDEDYVQLNENLIYESTSDIGQYVVTILQDDTAKRFQLQGTYILRICEVNMILAEQPSLTCLYTFPYQFIRKYGASKTRLTFEAGSKCPTGIATFHLDSDQARQISESIAVRMEVMKGRQGVATARPPQYTPLRPKSDVKQRPPPLKVMGQSVSLDSELNKIPVVTPTKTHLLKPIDTPPLPPPARNVKPRSEVSNNQNIDALKRELGKALKPEVHDGRKLPIYAAVNKGLQVPTHEEEEISGAKRKASRKVKKSEDTIIQGLHKQAQQGKTIDAKETKEKGTADGKSKNFLKKWFGRKHTDEASKAKDEDYSDYDGSGQHSKPMSSKLMQEIQDTKKFDKVEEDDDIYYDEHTYSIPAEVMKDGTYDVIRDVSKKTSRPLVPPKSPRSPPPGGTSPKFPWKHPAIAKKPPLVRNSEFDESETYGTVDELSDDFKNKLQAGGASSLPADYEYAYCGETAVNHPPGQAWVSQGSDPLEPKSGLSKAILEKPQDGSLEDDYYDHIESSRPWAKRSTKKQVKREEEEEEGEYGSLYSTIPSKGQKK